MNISKTQRIDIEESLGSFGLSSPERQAYLKLLEAGVSTATPLARALKFPLTTVQSLLQRLEAKGLAQMTKKRSRSVYEAHDPAVLKSILERKARDIGEIVPLLRSIQAEARPSAKIRVFSRERVADIFNEALAAEDKQIHEIVAARELQEVLGERFHFTKRRVALGVKLRSLRVEASEIKRYSRETHLRELREAKFLPRELTFRDSVMFWDQKVAFFSTADEGLAWVMECASARQMWQQLFGLLWEISRRMETGTSDV